VPVAVADAEPSEESVPYVSIILPCYNEEGHVTVEVERICAAMDTSGYSYEVLAIDDASTDQTLACHARRRHGSLTWRSCTSTATAGRAWCGASVPSGRGARSSPGPTPT